MRYHPFSPLVRVLPSIALGASLVAAAGCATGAPRAAARPAPDRATADLAFRGGTVWTADSARPRASAVAVRGGRIVYVGDESGLARRIGDATRVVDLRGGMLLPGFHDSHVHPVSGGVELGECSLTDDETRADLLAHIARCARELPAGAWLRGGGWQLPLFPGASPGREVLDSLAPDRPALLWAADGHSAWANSRALALAGVSAATPDPADGRIERDSAGAPSGTLREDAAGLVARHLPPYTAADLERGARRGLEMAASFGITSLVEASADSGTLAAYAALARRGELTARVRVSLHVDPDEGVPEAARIVALGAMIEGAGDAAGLLRAGAAKIFADGVIEAHTASLLEPYIDTGDRGPTDIAPARLDSLVVALDRAGLQVHVHAIGDRAVRAALDAFAAARRANGRRDSRHHIAHLQMIDTADIPRFGELGVFANFQPLWAQRDSYITDLTEPVLGPERSSRLYPIGSVARSGATIVAGSDWSVSSMNPIEAMQVAVTRRATSAGEGPPWLPAERVSLERILRAYTIDGARLAFQERETGSIEVGKAADLVVLDRDILTAAPGAIHEARVLTTYLAGREVWRR